ncbi:MAG: adenine phosphoribosyltransferase [Actinomycetia bacterium]|nr:adenine phosphoribosyltransferase [Actinomycetes bacterium]
MAERWPEKWDVGMGLPSGKTVNLPLVRGEDGFSIYALDMMGETVLNAEAAEALRQRLAAFDFDIILTAEAKAIALAQELARSLNNMDYVVLRKSLKLYMHNPVSVEVKSITTNNPQRFYLGEDKLQELCGKRICILDDVLSTGGTMRAIMHLAEQTDCEIAVIAVVLTEEIGWQEFEGVPVVSLGHIPLPGASEFMTD